MTEENSIVEKKLSEKDLRRTYARWWLSVEVSNSYERLQALAFCNALSESLKKIYKDDKEGYKEALHRHLEFYNSEGTIGSVIHGVTLSMEEEIAEGDSGGSNVTGEVVTGLKTGLMGPIAGIGDTLIWGTLKPIVLALASSLALSGLFIGGLVPFLFPLIVILVGYTMLKTGYTLGKESIAKIMESGLMNNIINSASILGLFMMGALSSTYIKVSTPLEISFKNANEPIVIQEILDQILIGILPLTAVFSIYFFFKLKGQHYNKLILMLILISLVTGYFGILTSN